MYGYVYVCFCVRVGMGMCMHDVCVLLCARVSVGVCLSTCVHAHVQTYFCPILHWGRFLKESNLGSTFYLRKAEGTKTCPQSPFQAVLMEP